MAITQVEFRLISRVLNGRTLTATFTDDMFSEVIKLSCLGTLTRALLPLTLYSHVQAPPEDFRANLALQDCQGELSF